MADRCSFAPSPLLSPFFLSGSTLSLQVVSLLFFFRPVFSFGTTFFNFRPPPSGRQWSCFFDFWDSPKVFLPAVFLVGFLFFVLLLEVEKSTRARAVLRLLLPRFLRFFVEVPSGRNLFNGSPEAVSFVCRPFSRFSYPHVILLFECSPPLISRISFSLFPRNGGPLDVSNTIEESVCAFFSFRMCLFFSKTPSKKELFLFPTTPPLFLEIPHPRNRFHGPFSQHLFPLLGLHRFPSLFAFVAFNKPVTPSQVS